MAETLFTTIYQSSMTVAENDIREVIQAVRAIYDSSTLNQERRRCTEVILCYLKYPSFVLM